MKSPVDNSKRKILVIDDDEMSAKFILKSLQFEGYQIESAASGEEGLAKIENWQPHLILLDIQMPGISGLEVIRSLRAKEHYVSVIFISGNSDVTDVVAGLDAGADDYIRKPFNPQELLARVRAQLRIKDLNDQLAVVNAKLLELIDQDDLTGLYNMRSLYKKLAHELERGRRYNRSVCVVMMDMDHFKSVNDSHDHLFGSFVLSEVGKLIRKNIRNVDFAARYGGDEFLIVLTEIDLNGAQIFCQRLRSSIANYTFENGPDRMQLTASLGFALSSPHARIDEKDLVRLADRALYDAKASGRNRVCFYECEKASPEDYRSLRKSN